jgi:hypothetical protein
MALDEHAVVQTVADLATDAHPEQSVPQTGPKHWKDSPLFQEQGSYAEHLAWAKARALKCLEACKVTGPGRPRTAFLGFCADLSRHPETADHPALTLGQQLLESGVLLDIEKMKEFISNIK